MARQMRRRGERIEHLSEHSQSRRDRSDTVFGEHIFAANAQVGGAEEDPADDDAQENELAVETPPHHCRVRGDPAARFERVEHDEHRAMPRPPDHEEPCRAVPQAAEQHRDHEVAVLPESPAAIASERNVQVIAQPERERHVPAPPEVARIGGLVRAVKILGKANGKEMAEANGHVGVAGEIKVDAERISQYRGPAPDKAEILSGAKGIPHRVDRRGETIGEDQLLGHPHREKE